MREGDIGAVVFDAVGTLIHPEPSAALAYAQAGRTKDAERIAALVPRPSNKIVIFAALGDKDRTFELLNQLVPTGPVRIGRILVDPDFALLRGDPRLKALRKKVGLPD